MMSLLERTLPVFNYGRPARASQGAVDHDRTLCGIIESIVNIKAMLPVVADIEKPENLENCGQSKN